MNSAFELLLDKLSAQAAIKDIPLNGAFELTSRCSLNCKMCYVHTNRDDTGVKERELTAQQWIRLAEDAREAGMLNLILTGGEVFVRQDFEEIYEHLARMGFNINLYSNATLIDEKKVKWLGRIPPAQMEITLYGASADTYERLCGNRDAYRAAIRNIDLLLSEGVNIELKTTVTYDNMKDYAELAEFAYKRGLPLSIVDYLYPARVAACTAEENRLSPEDLADFLKTVDKTNRHIYGDNCNEQQGQESESRQDKLLQELMDIKQSSGLKTSAFRCNAGKSDFWITWDGRMLPCGVLEEPSALPLEYGFKKAWELVGSGCKSIPLCRQCYECRHIEYCNMCPAKLKSETGHFDRPAPYLCRLAELVGDRMEKLATKD